MYPTSADLAAFRRALLPGAGHVPMRGSDGFIHPEPMRPYRWTDGDPSRLAGRGLIASERVALPPVAGAFPEERREGIGPRDRSSVPCRVRHYGRVPCAVEAGDRYARMRREAAAMRSRAFAARAGRMSSLAPHQREHPPMLRDGEQVHAWMTELAYGCPAPVGY